MKNSSSPRAVRPSNALAVRGRGVWLMILLMIVLLLFLQKQNLVFKPHFSNKT